MVLTLRNLYFKRTELLACNLSTGERERETKQTNNEAILRHTGNELAPGKCLSRFTQENKKPNKPRQFFFVRTLYKRKYLGCLC